MNKERHIPVASHAEQSFDAGSRACVSARAAIPDGVAAAAANLSSFASLDGADLFKDGQT